MGYGIGSVVRKMYHINKNKVILFTRKGTIIDQVIMIIETITKTMTDPNITKTLELTTRTELSIMTLEVVGSVENLITGENIETIEEIKDRMTWEGEMVEMTKTIKIEETIDQLRIKRVIF